MKVISRHEIVVPDNDNMPQGCTPISPATHVAVLSHETAEFLREIIVGIEGDDNGSD